MLVLFVMFGTFLAMGMPIVTALIAVTTSLSLIAVLSNVINTAQFATFLSIMIGLGVGIDYALFVVTRFRQNMRHGVEPTEAVIQSMDTAGRAVLFAGITVMIALLGLFLVGMNFLYGPALAASMTVLLTMVASLTLLPALLTIAGPRINDPFFPTLTSAIKRNFAKFTNGQVLSGIVSLPLLILQVILLPLSYLFYAIVIWLPQKLLGSLRLPVPHRSHAQIDEGENAHPRWHKWSSWVQRRPWPVAIVTTGISDRAFDPGVLDEPRSRRLRHRPQGDDHAPGLRPAGHRLRRGLQRAVAGGDRQRRRRGQDRRASSSRSRPTKVSRTSPRPPPVPTAKIYVINIFPTTSPQSTLTNDLVHRIRADLQAAQRRRRQGPRRRHHRDLRRLLDADHREAADLHRRRWCCSRRCC